jgi:hypothetical protein
MSTRDQRADLLESDIDASNACVNLLKLIIDCEVSSALAPSGWCAAFAPSCEVTPTPTPRCTLLEAPAVIDSEGNKTGMVVERGTRDRRLRWRCPPTLTAARL